MKIKGIRLQNFRGFRDAKIELKPLTVLLGPNSAGKSSFGHALAAMSHAHRVFAGTPQTTLTPTKDSKSWPVDLGDLGDLRTEGASGPVKIELETSAGACTFGFGLESVAGLLPSYFLFPKGEESTGKTVGVPENGGSAGGVGISSGAQTGPADQKALDKIVEDVAQNRCYEVQRLNARQWQESGIESIVILDGLDLKAVTHMGGTAVLLSGAAQSDIKFLFENISYLRATRERPSRTYPEGTGTPQEIGYSGEWIATVLDRRSTEPVAYAKLADAPNALDDSCTFEFDRSILHEDTLLGGTREWLRHLGLATALTSISSAAGTKDRKILITVPNQTAHNITEIGFGVSQVLPVIVAGLLQPKDSLFLVDLPEAHLHPRPQAELADFFCSLALSGRCCLVETHSELFFSRLRLRAAMDENVRMNTAVYFIDEPQDGKCQQPISVGLTSERQAKWPKGFMREAWELESQIALVRRARKNPQVK